MKIPIRVFIIFSLLSFYLIQKVIADGHGRVIYLTFSSFGITNSIDSIQVINLDRSNHVTLNGNDTLHLTGVVGLKIDNAPTYDLAFYPNPLEHKSVFQFKLDKPGPAHIIVTDLMGRSLIERDYSLDDGLHQFSLQGFTPGTYLLSIISSDAYLTKTFIANGHYSRHPAVEYISSENSIVSESFMKSPSGTLVKMEYIRDETLHFLAYSGSFKRIITLQPNMSQHLEFEFISCVDGDGNHYPVVEIAGSIWMAENLKSTTYIDGSSIDYPGGDHSAWNSNTSGAYTVYDNNEAYLHLYGALYNYYAATHDTGLCPFGWQLPTLQEWMNMNIEVGGGINLKSQRIEPQPHPRWDSDNIGATNYTGFEAVPSGFRHAEVPGFFMLGQFSRGWTSTKLNLSEAYIWVLSFDTNGFGWGVRGFNHGYSVRCLLDR